MKKITLSLCTMLLAVMAWCNTPQAISYQAVAMGASGAPLANRPISLRLSILAGSSGGPVSYEERQVATTGETGIVSLSIGNGTVLAGSFTSINWATGIYYLKTEIDTNAGTNYQPVGTVQFFSVPYSMYSGTAGTANLSSPDFPDGLNSITPVRLDGAFSYIVPVGNTLYITSITSNGSAVCTDFGALVDGVYISSSEPSAAANINPLNQQQANIPTLNRYIANNPITVPAARAITSSSCGTSLVGFTIPTSYPWVLFDLSTGNYTVPVNKVLVLKNMIYSSASAWNKTYTVGGLTTTFNESMTVVDQGQTISASALSSSVLMMGYLKDR